MNIKRALVNGVLFGIVIGVSGYNYSQWQTWVILGGLISIVFNMIFLAIEMQEKSKREAK